MKIQVNKARLEEIRDFRNEFLQESKFQFVYNKCHQYGWADAYLFMVDGTAVGYGAVWGQNKREDRDAIFEFYVTSPFRKFVSFIFCEFRAVSGATFIECQSNDLLLSSMLFEYTQNISADAILFEDDFQTNLETTGLVFSKGTQGDSIVADSGEYLLKQHEDVIATGGYMMNYNLPYADIYYEVKPNFRKKGFGSLIIQELKKEIYSIGRVPSARCNISNQASKANLLKAGFKVCGFLLKGEIKIITG